MCAYVLEACLSLALCALQLECSASIASSVVYLEVTGGSNAAEPGLSVYSLEALSWTASQSVVFV